MFRKHENQSEPAIQIHICLNTDFI